LEDWIDTNSPVSDIINLSLGKQIRPRRKQSCPYAEAIDTCREAQFKLQEFIALAQEADVCQLAHSCRFIPGETPPDRELDGDENQPGLGSDKNNLCPCRD
jgi:hypothetical protein